MGSETRLPTIVSIANNRLCYLPSFNIRSAICWTKMDPLSAMSLACNIIQVIDFSTKVVNSCRQLYKDGALSGNQDVEAMTKYHTSLRNHLDLPNQRSPDELLELGRKCSDTADDLIKELQKLKIKGPRKKREVASKAFKTFWKKDAIDEIWRRLCDYKKILDTHILVDLRCVNVHLTLKVSSWIRGIYCMNVTISEPFSPIEIRKTHIFTI